MGKKTGEKRDKKDGKRARSSSPDAGKTVEEAKMLGVGSLPYELLRQLGIFKNDLGTHTVQWYHEVAQHKVPSNWNYQNSWAKAFGKSYRTS